MTRSDYLKNLMIIKNFLLFIFFMSSFNSLAQKNVICLNEKGVSIPVFDFYHKNKTSIYNHVSIETDSVIFKRLRYNYYFGDLRKDIKSQFFKLLYQKHGIDTTKALVIHYRDTIKAMKNFPKRDSVVHEGETEKWHWHLLSYKGFKRNHFKYDFKRDTNSSAPYSKTSKAGKPVSWVTLAQAGKISSFSISSWLTVMAITFLPEMVSMAFICSCNECNL